MRESILQKTRVSPASTCTPILIEPRVSVQTSVLVLQRKTEEEIAVEKAAGRMNDYEVFMAVANHIGHDKRGNVTYVRDKKGNEIVEEVEETLQGVRGGQTGLQETAHAPEKSHRRQHIADRPSIQNMAVRARLEPHL